MDPHHTSSPLSVIVPVYNEAKTILSILDRVRANSLVREIIVVDDASTDGTQDVLAALQNNPFPGLKIYFHEKNQGKSAGIRTGISHSTSPITLVQDADLEYDPSEYQKLVDPILSGTADVVYGSRFSGKGGSFSFHTFGNQLLTALSNFFTGLKLTDMETCYKTFKTEILQQIPIRSNRFGFEPEITAKVAKLKCRIVEVPISYQGRSYAQGKKIGWKDGVSAIATIVKFWWRDDLRL